MAVICLNTLTSRSLLYFRETFPLSLLPPPWCSRSLVSPCGHTVPHLLPEKVGAATTGWVKTGDSWESPRTDGVSLPSTEAVISP